MILIKYSEIALKGANRGMFESKLAKNIAAQCNVELSQVKRLNGRIIITGEYDRLKIKNHLARVFGVHSFAFVRKVHKNMASIVDIAERVALNTAEKLSTFSIATNRADKSFPQSSQKVNETVGAAIGEKHPKWQVDLDNPDLTIRIDIREDGVFVYTNFDEFAGPGGLPLGTGGKALALLSGGIDSPVAIWQMMRRGVHTDAVYFHSPPFVGEKTKEKVRDIMRCLARWSPIEPRLFVVDFSDVQVALKEAPEKYWTLLFRRSMHRIAERIAQENNYHALVSGDNVGQVASQTIENINAVDGATRMWVARPLLGALKQETIELAKRIGTYEISTEPYEDCCTVFTPTSPATAAKREDLEDIEFSITALGDLELKAAKNLGVF